MNSWLNAWIPCLLIALVLQIIYIYEDIDISNIDKLSNTNKLIVSLLAIVYTVGILLFIIWLFQFKDKTVLMHTWICALIILIASIVGRIFLDNDKLKNSFDVISGFSTTIFFGTLIAFFVKKPTASTASNDVIYLKK